MTDLEELRKAAEKATQGLSVWRCDPQTILSLIGEIERLRLALRIIAGKEQCIDNLMSNADVALAALAEPVKEG
jgi:hypothetical protein